jgi:hypothetical protein
MTLLLKQNRHNFACHDIQLKSAADVAVRDALRAYVFTHACLQTYMHTEDIGDDEEDDEQDVMADVESVPSGSEWSAGSDAEDGVL